MRKLTLLALAVATAAVLAACGTGGASGLTGKAWQLTAITEKVPAFQGVIPAADQSKYVITFNTDNTFTGTADCNQIAGTYRTTGSSGLTITPGISTMAFCPEESFGALFTHGLGRAKSYTIVNEQLTITLEDEGTMVFVVGPAASPSPAASNAPAASAAATATAKPTAKPTPKPTAKPTANPTVKPTTAPGVTPAPSAPPAASTGLTGKVWQLTAITEKVPAFQGVVPADQQANYNVQFMTDLSFSAKADCNTLSGTYETVDATASSGDLLLTTETATQAACPPGSYSDLYMIALSKVSSYAIVNNQLTITLIDEGTLVYK